MACDMRIDLSADSKRRLDAALDRLRKALGTGEASIVVNRVTGAIAFKGWTGAADGIMDGCAFRRLISSGSPELRRALARAEAIAGRKANPATASHSHDEGKTWQSGH